MTRVARHRDLRRSSRDSRGRDSPNGNTIDITGSDFWRFDGDLIVKYHLYFDYTSISWSSCANSD